MIEIFQNPEIAAEREQMEKRRIANAEKERERAIHRAEWAAVRERNLTTGNIPQPVKKENVNMNQSIIIAALIVAVAIVLAAFISRPSTVSRYRSIGTNKIYDAQTGEVKWADPQEEKK